MKNRAITLTALFAIAAATPAQASVLDDIFFPERKTPSPTYPEPPKEELFNRINWKTTYDRTKAAAKQGGVKTPYTGDAVIKPKLLDGGGKLTITWKL